MEQPKLSLVFPCWHAAQHMPHILEDLQAQTLKEFEAILVNDGDDSQVEAMERIAAEDSRIRIIHLKKNGGAAIARNVGTDAVTTPWVTYPDSDDRFGANYTKSLYDAVDGKDVEIACGGFTWLNVRAMKYSNHHLNIDKSPIVMDMAHGYDIIQHAAVSYNFYNKLYSMEVIRRNNLSLDQNFTSYEDAAFNMKYFYYVKRIGLVKDCGYIYYQYNADTLSNRYNPLLMQNTREIINLSVRFYHHIGWEEQRILDCQTKELAYFSLQFCYHLFSYHSPLTINTATKKIQDELLSQPEIVKAISELDCGKDRLMRLFKQLTKKGNARMIALTFKTLCIGKRRFGNLYARVKPLFRGD